MKSIIQKISYQIRPYALTHKKTGKNAFGLQIVIDGDARMLNIQLNWYKNDFDYTAEKFSAKDNPEIIRDLNLTIGKEKSRTNDIITRFRLTNRQLTHKIFRWEFSNYSSREDIHEYLSNRALKLLNDGEVKAHTYHNYLSSFARLKNYKKDPISFTEINTGFLIKFDAHLRSTFKHNTVVGTHKNLKKFFKLAIIDGLITETPYTSKINTNYKDGDRQSLEPGELELLIGLFKEKNRLTPQMLNVLEMFVFSATSGGYRFSELEILHSDNVRFGRLKLNTVKGYKTGIELNIDLPNIGQKIISERKGKIFEKVAEPTANRLLKDLTSMVGIKKHITFHSARDTFGTLYVYYGGDITTLSKEIFKHSSLETTMIYQKKSTDMKRKDMELFNRFDF